MGKIKGQNAECRKDKEQPCPLFSESIHSALFETLHHLFSE